MVIKWLMLPLVAALLVPTASAATLFEAVLTPDQEVPPTVSLGTGVGSAVYDPATFILAVNLSWTGLTGPPAAGHIHCCPGPGVNGPVAIDFVPVGFPTAPGIFTADFDLTAAASYGGGFLGSFGGDVSAAREAVLTGMNANLTYFNIHTAAYPGGEIRGDITVVPEPATIGLVALALGAVVLRRHLRRA